jgi:hypothetical protein
VTTPLTIAMAITLLKSSQRVVALHLANTTRLVFAKRSAVTKLVLSSAVPAYFVKPAAMLAISLSVAPSAQVGFMLSAVTKLLSFIVYWK